MLDFLNGLLEAVLSPPSISGDTLKFNLTNKGAIHGDILGVLFDVCSSLAMALTIVYFLIEMNRRFVFEASDMTLKTVFVPFLKLLGALGLITHAKSLAIWVMSGFNSMVDTVVASNSLSWYGDIETVELSGLGLIASAFVMLPLLLCWLVSLIVEVAYWYKAIGFKLEFFYRAAVTPVAMADIYNDFSSGSIRWIKGLFAFALYGLAFLILPALCVKVVEEMNLAPDLKTAAEALADDFMESVWAFFKALIASFLAPIAALGTLSVVKQLTKEAVGG